MAARRSLRHLINSSLGFCPHSTFYTSTSSRIAASSGGGGGGGVLSGAAAAPAAAAHAPTAAAAAATVPPRAAAFLRPRAYTAFAEPATTNMEQGGANGSSTSAAATNPSKDGGGGGGGGGGCCGGHHHHHHHQHKHGEQQQHHHQAAAAPPPPPPPPPQPPLDSPTAARLQTPAPPPAPGVQRTFYKRKLPCPPAIEFSSAEGRAVFAEALAGGTMNGFFKLIEQLSTQDEPAFCGLASLAMVLNALAIDPRRPWKGAWRWFHEKLLDCCLPLDAVASGGIALSQAACLAKCNGARVELHRAGAFSLDEFRAALLACAASGDEHVVVSYSRRAFLQTGDGHFSPVGGVHAARDLALILDTARFKYPPHWVPIPLLYEAMQAVDPATGKPRGYLRLGADGSPGSVLFTLDVRGGGNGTSSGGGSGSTSSSNGGDNGAAWRDAARFGHEAAPQAVAALARKGAAEPQAVLERLVEAAPLGAVGAFVAVRFAADACAKDRCVPHAVRAQVLQELRATPLYQLAAPILAATPARAAGVEFAAEKLCILLLLLPPSGWPQADAWASPAQHAAWHQLLETSAVSILESEVGFLRRQFEHLGDVLAGGGDHEADACGTCNPAAAAAAAGPGGGSGEVIEPVGLCSGHGAVAGSERSGGGERSGGRGGGAAAGAVGHDDAGAKGCCH